MKRGDVIRYLVSQGCELLREGGGHSIWWNPANNARSSVPRHNEVDDGLFRVICKDLQIPRPNR